MIEPRIFATDPLRRRILLTAAWVKNDHLGFEVHYLFEGGVHRYRPDFLVRLANGFHLVLEVKGQDTAKDRAKRDAMKEWVAAVNEHGGFGRWASDVSSSPSDVADILARNWIGPYPPDQWPATTSPTAGEPAPGEE